MAEDTTGLDQFLSGQGLDPASIKKAEDATAEQRTTDANKKKATATVAKARSDAEQAAKDLKNAIANAADGRLNKSQLDAYYKIYVAAQDQLYTMDAPNSQKIQEKYFPGSKLQQTPPPASKPDISNNSVTQLTPNATPAKSNTPSLTPSTPSVVSTPANIVGTSTAGQQMGEHTGANVGQLGLGDSSYAEWAKQYGAIGAMALTLPWMSNLLAQAAKNGWTAEKFVNEIKNYTDPTSGQRPWDSMAASYRDSTLAYYDNKQAWAQQYNDKLTILQQSAIRQGLDPSVFGEAVNLNDAAAIDAAYKDQHSGVNSFFNVYYNNMPDMGVIDKYVSNHTTLAKTDLNVYAGMISQNVDALKSYSNDMGVASQYLPRVQGTSGDYYANAAKAIQDGTTTLQEQQNYIKEQAIAMYSPFANRIKEGMSVRALASPYVNAASNLLENQDPTAFDLGSTTGYGAMVTKAMQGDGQAPMALDKFITSVKQRPEWLQTGNARNSLMDTATQLLRNFGMVTGG